MPADRILTTLRYTDEAAWDGRADILDPTVRSGAGQVRALVAAARRYPALVLDGSTHVDQLAAAIIGSWPRRARPRVVMSDATWRRGVNPLDRALGWAGMRAMDGAHMTFAVLTSFEQRRFPQTWSVDPERVVFTPFCWTLEPDELEPPASDEPCVFAGGESFRDYEPLVEAARRLDVPVTIASRRLDGATDLPPNVRGGRRPHAEFIAEMRRARISVVPLPAAADRGAGQTTYLNSMVLGKVTIVTDSLGATDYVEHRRTGLVVPPGDADALADAITWSLDPGNADEVAALRATAREVALTEFSPQRYVGHLLAAADGRKNRFCTSPAS